MCVCVCVCVYVFVCVRTCMCLRACVRVINVYSAMSRDTMSTDQLDTLFEPNPRAGVRLFPTNWVLRHVLYIFNSFTFGETNGFVLGSNRCAVLVRGLDLYRKIASKLRGFYERRHTPNIGATGHCHSWIINSK